ncbi:MAG: L-aspartate oxidase [Alphaproteobacteria bacterium]|nr:L-aspartate oxidase [Alphaproteobacteria bacterium]
MRSHDPAMRSASAIIIGGGIAGLTAALKLAPRPVVLLLNAPLGSGASTGWAQGGISAAMAPGDSPQQHASDTLCAAAGIADAAIVALATSEAPGCIEDMIAMGALFDRTPGGELALGREAAHSVNRIVHIGGDGTGAGLMRALIAAVQTCPSITVVENVAAEELMTSQGRVCGVIARAIDDTGDGPLYLRVPAVVLATGGIGGLYAVTTNPPGCTGAGLAMAAKAGARLSDLEFVQFHPTAMDIGLAPAPLASEALRGEGAVLVNELGDRFMRREHAAAELAPRDVVARAIWRQMRDGHKVFLDCRAALGDTFAQRFPTVYALAMKAGINPSTDLIPVAPAAHYHMGGVATDSNGRTSVPGLWACGEVAATGLHGANRLASNSLLEGLVFGARAALDIAAQNESAPAAPVETAMVQFRAQFRAQFWAYDTPELAPLVQRLRELMSLHAGVVRNEAGLRAALGELDGMLAEAGNRSARVCNMLVAARLVCIAALRRCESRGGHYREDYPETDPAQQRRSFLYPFHTGVEPQIARVRA